MPGFVSEALVLTTLLLHPINNAKSVDNQLYCMSTNVYHEARGASTKAQLGVAHVTSRRVINSRKKGKVASVCKIVWTPKQFSWTMQLKMLRKSEFEERRWHNIVLMSASVMNGKTRDPTRGATHFCEKRVRAKTPWCRNARVMATIDNLVFVIPHPAKPKKSVKPTRRNSTSKKK